MIKEINLSLVAYYSSGDSITGDEFAKAISADVSKLTVAGNGDKWESGRIESGALRLKEFKKKGEEYHELYAKAVREAFGDFAKWLATLAPRGFDRLRAKGAMIDLMIMTMMDQNQFDLDLTPEFMGELARLGVPLKISTDG